MDSNIVGSGASLTVSAARFLPLQSTADSWASSAAVNGQDYSAITATISSFSVNMDVADATQSRTIAIAKNGVATAVTVTLGATVTAGSDTTHSFSYVPTDTLSVITTASGATTATGFIRWTCKSTAAANISSVMNYSVSNLSVLATTYMGLQGGSNESLAIAAASVMPTAGTLKNAYMIATGAPGTGASYTATLFKSGSSSGITMSISGNVATTTSDLTHTASVVAGNELHWEVVPSAGTPPTARSIAIGMEFDPTVNGESIYLFTSSATLPTAVREQSFFSNNDKSYSTSANVSDKQVLTQAADWKKLYAFNWVDPNPGSYQYQLNKNATPSTLSATVTSGSQSANDTTHTITTVLGDLVNIRVTPASSPVTGLLSLGIVTFIAPPVVGTKKLAAMGVG